MRTMIFGHAPPLEEVLESVFELERVLNGKGNIFEERTT